jgi:hypothetical protein
VVHVVAAVDVAAPVGATWDLLVDWPAHGRWVPLTTVTVLTPAATGVGARFVGRTGIGPLAFDDPMEVTQWSPPGGGAAGHCTVVKLGRVVLGTARFDVTPRPAGGCRVTWAEDIEIAPVRLSRLLAPVVARLGRVGVGRVLRAMARELEGVQVRR